MFYCYLKDIKKEREKLAKLSQKSGDRLPKTVI